MRSTLLFLLLYCGIISAQTQSLHTDKALEYIQNGQISKGSDELKKAALNMNELAAQYYLGECYEYGIMVEKNTKEAFKFYRRAAERGLPDAMYRMSLCYKNGIGVTPNGAQASEWLKRYRKKGGYMTLRDLPKIYNSGMALANDINDNTEIPSDISNITSNSVTQTQVINNITVVQSTQIHQEANDNLADKQISKDIRNQETKQNEADVDVNIPVTQLRNSSTLALVIANENYSNVPTVESALHDGEVVAAYLQKTLGLPKENIMVRKDVTLGNMLRSVAQMKNTVKAMGEDVDVIVYYAGHGMPDEATKDAFLLPVDGDPMTSESCYSLDRLYKELGNSGAKNVIVFLDACFSGSRRGDGMLTSARGVAIKPKDFSLHGNMFILSATSGQETALPYKEKNHGMFTYYLLKKLQQTAGNVTLKDLADDIKANVSRQSNLINQKPQTPQIFLSGEMRDSYVKIKLIRDDF